MPSDWFFLVLVVLTDNSLQSADKDQPEMRAVAEKPHDAIVKLDTVRIEICSGPACDSAESSA